MSRLDPQFAEGAALLATAIARANGHSDPEGWAQRVSEELAALAPPLPAPPSGGQKE